MFDARRSLLLSWKTAGLMVALGLLLVPAGASAAPLFGSPVNLTTGTSPQSVASGDFNADGRPDVAIANQGSASVSILLGNGSGGLGPKTDFTTAADPFSVTSGDFNADGNLDLARASEKASQQSRKRARLPGCG